MRGLTADEILSAAESPDFKFDQLAAAFSSRTPVGRADAALLQLRAATLGPLLEGVTDCPNCGTALEFDVPAAGLLAVGSYDQAPERASYRWSGLGAQVEYRLATAEDLESIAARPDSAAAEVALFERLVLGATVDGQPVEASALGREVVDAVDQDMAGHDPQAETILSLTCAECGHAWPAPFDIGSFFRRELAAESRRLLGEVHVLARAYGWREADILALSPARRRAYIDLLEAGSRGRLT